MKLKILFCVLASIHALATVSMAASTSPNDVVSIKESYEPKAQAASSIVTLRNGKKFIDVGYTLQSLGELKSKTHSALLFKGVVCMDCPADLSLFVLPLYPNARKTQFPYPGLITTIHTDKSKGTVAKSTAVHIETYFGDCLKNGKANLINVKEVMNLPGKSVEVWNLNDSGDLVFGSIEKEAVVNQILASVKAKKCTVIKGANRDVNEG